MGREGDAGRGMGGEWKGGEEKGGEGRTGEYSHFFLYTLSTGTISRYHDMKCHDISISSLG